MCLAGYGASLTAPHGHSSGLDLLAPGMTPAALHDGASSILCRLVVVKCREEQQQIQKKNLKKWSMFFLAS
ncbi:unnamed protein product [Amoebophrya sp. A25]|nr:unnamed protein product [Amoebophrya sp. A25]|eukprot:GSA25T00027621001.1